MKERGQLGLRLLWFLLRVLEIFDLAQPLFRRFLALIWPAQVFSFARCDFVTFSDLFDHFTLAIFHEHAADLWLNFIRGRWQEACATTSRALPVRELPTLQSLPRVRAPSQVRINGRRSR
jgi:hypothetical protein